MQDLKIAAIQTHQYWEDIATNLAHFSKNITGILEKVDLILLPEMFNTSFSMNTALAEKMDGISIKWMIDQATKTAAIILGTLMIEENGQYYNRMVAVNHEGVIDYYDKRHLFRMAGENDYFTAGGDKKIISLNGWKILLQTCYDLRFPEFSRNTYVKEKAEYDLAVYLANWPAKRSYAWSVLLQARAIENQSFLIGLNRIGEDGNNNLYNGQSAAYDPWGIVLWQGKEKETTHIITLQYDTLKKIRIQFNSLLDS